MMELPSVLLEAMKDQRAVLFLGAGASYDAKHPSGNKIPSGDKLRDIICDQFFSGKMKEKSLTAASSMAANEVGYVPFQKFIHDLFEPFRPTDFHLLIPQFRWKAIATTNFDLIVERAYEAAPDPLQTLVKTVKDGDNFDHRMSAETHPVGMYKLHGCIASYTDEAIPLILGNEQYASYELNRKRFYARFRDLGYEYPIVFAGYSISDPHIQRILFDLTELGVARPMYFFISPGINPIEARYWASHRIACIDGTIEEFLNAADIAIPSQGRKLSADTGGGALSIRKHYRVASAAEPSALSAYLADDVTHVHAGMIAAPQKPTEFYRGSDSGWGCILQNLDAKRSVTDSVLIDAVLDTDHDGKITNLYMLKGPAGNGKTVSLKRIAWEAGVTYEQLVLFAHGPSAFRIDVIDEINRLTGKRILLFVDHVALVRSEVFDLLRACKSRSIPISIFGTERDNEWNIYCDFLEPFLTQEFPVRYLNETEIVDLIGLLENSNALGILKDKNPAERLDAFVNVAERQLLVALHETTLGLAFADILFDEYGRIEPPLARRLYLDICAMHQFGAPVRAGLISRASGVSFEEFGSNFMAPLESVVRVVKNEHTGDIFYGARHQCVASLVFNRVLPEPEDKFDLLVRLITAINVDYSSDRETFTRLIKGRGIAEIFPNIELGRLFYDRLEEVSPRDAFVNHQRAVFEMSHSGGSLVLAEAAAQNAFEVNPNSHSIQHTQGEISRRLANETDDPLRKQTLRRISREKVGGQLSRNVSEYDLYTSARLAIDELKEELNLLEAQVDDDALPSNFVEATKNAEIVIQKGLQLFPESSEILSAEASFHDLLNQTGKAQRALEKAFKLNPRQDWLAVRLARRYQEVSDWENGTRVLDACLRDNPSSKMAHLQYARILMAADGDGPLILDHLKRSFTLGDTYFEAQFWFARELFLQSKFPESKTAFAEIHERSPGRFRTSFSAPALKPNGAQIVYEGKVERLEEGYAFIRVAQFPTALFASRSDSSHDEWEKLNSGGAVLSSLAFSRRGARAINVRSA